LGENSRSLALPVFLASALVSRIAAPTDQKGHGLQGRRYNNIPIELLRTLVLIADTGSVTQAAAALGLTQSAVSAQIKRLETYVSGEVFSKRGRGIELTERGKMIASHARRIVAMCDQLQSLAGSDARNPRLRVGLPSGLDHELVGQVLAGLSALQLEEGWFLTCDTRDALLRALGAGHVDVVFIAETTPIAAKVFSEWWERWEWVKAPHFVLSPGAPVPLIGWPGSLSDRICMAALQRSGVEYSVVLTAHDRSIRKAAAMAGVGLMAASQRSLEVSNLSIARDYYLPPLPEIRVGLYLREGLDDKLGQRVSAALEQVLRPTGSRSHAAS
jgi:DNA-binding transcriptional LysR family regulator